MLIQFSQIKMNESPILLEFWMEGNLPLGFFCRKISPTLPIKWTIFWSIEIHQISIVLGKITIIPKPELLAHYGEEPKTCPNEFFKYHVVTWPNGIIFQYFTYRFFSPPRKKNGGPVPFPETQKKRLHPGRLTSGNLQITHDLNQTSREFLFHAQLQGCKRMSL